MPSCEKIFPLLGTHCRLPSAPIACVVMTMSDSGTPAISSKQLSNLPSQRMMMIILVGTALMLRLPLLSQSYWYDELYSLLHYIMQPWGNIVGLHAGALSGYSPNNHVLYSLLVKLFFQAGVESETLARLPSLLAGSVVGIALAWPLPATHSMGQQPLNPIASLSWRRHSPVAIRCS